MITVFDASRTVPYSLVKDTSEPRTVFHLGYFNRQLYHHLVDKHLANLGDLDDDGRKAASRAFVEDLVRFGVKSWQNLDGAPWDEDAIFSTTDIPGVGAYQSLTEKGMDLLPPAVLIELGNKINEMNFLQGTQGKN
jgi:hypothetical protein